MTLFSTIRRSILTKVYNLKKWRNVMIDIMVILILPVPIVLMSCKKGESSWTSEKHFEKYEPCPPSAMISTQPANNFNKVANYPVGDSVQYLGPLGLQDWKNVSSFQGNPVVVTAAGSDFFSYAEGLINRLGKSMSPKLKIVVYDLGMTPGEKVKVCGEVTLCKVRRFPFLLYPEFVQNDISIAAWKPVIIQMALQEYGFVIWMDSAVYLNDGNLRAGIDIAKLHGVAAGHKRVMFPDINLAFETDIQTFKALGEEPCAFRNSFRFNSALIFIRRTPFTYKYIMRPWVSCALTKSCIVAYRPSNMKCVGANDYGYCHRFDQSIFSIILNRVFQTKLTDIDLQDKVKWTKCYKKDTHTVYNEMLFYGKTGDVIECP